MANITSTDYRNPPLRLGDNTYDQATVSVPAGGIPKGAVLVRNGSGKFEPVTVTGGTSTLAYGAGLAIATEDMANGGDSAADAKCRVLVSGKVNRTMITAAGVAITDKEADILRGQSIIAEWVKDI
jgi:hypothetical protein